jgi:hypothetical protein
MSNVTGTAARFEAPEPWVARLQTVNVKPSIKAQKLDFSHVAKIIYNNN